MISIIFETFGKGLGFLLVVHIKSTKTVGPLLAFPARQSTHKSIRDFLLKTLNSRHGMAILNSRNAVFHFHIIEF